MSAATASPDWDIDCMHWRKRILDGAHAHWCFDWDFLPVDETTEEFAVCQCFPLAGPSGHLEAKP